MTSNILRRGWNRLSEERITIAYDGRVLADGTMDVRELAPALLSIADTIQKANDELNGSRARVTVRVNSDFRQGSFEVDIVVGQMVESIKDLVVPLFAANNIVAANTILQYLGLATGISGINAIGVFRWAKNRPIAHDGVTSNGMIQLRVDGDNNTIIVSPEVERLVRRPDLRKALRESLRPLEKDGIDEFRSQHHGEVAQRITKEEVVYFDESDAPEEKIAEFGGNAILELASPAFPDGRKWEFRYGEGRLFARITDEHFMRRVDNGTEAFRKGDRLSVEIIMRQIKKGQKIETDNEIVRVIEHFSRDEQIPLFDDDPPKKSN